MALFCIDGIILFGKEVATNIDILMTHLTNMLNNSHTKSGAFQISEIFSDPVAGKCQDSAHKWTASSNIFFFLKKSHNDELAS